MSNRRMTTLEALFVLGIGLGLALGDPGPLEAGEASEGDTTLRKQCILEAAAQLDLRSEVDRPLPVLFVVPEGKVAREGTLLLELDASAFHEELEEKRLELERAQAELLGLETSREIAEEEARAAREVAQKSLKVAEGGLKGFLSKKGAFQLERKKLTAAIQSAEERLAIETAIAERLSQLFKNGQADQNEWDEARLAVTEARAELEVSRAELEFLENVVKDREVAELELEVAVKKLELLRAENHLRTVRIEGGAAEKAARASQELAKRRLERVEKQVGACRIHAPRAGTVLYPGGPTVSNAARREIHRGAVVRPRQLLLRLLETKRLRIRLRVTLEKAQQVSPGQPAKVRVDAFPDRALEGRVARVGVTGPGSRTGEAEITVLVDNPDGQLRPGMTGRVSIDLPARPEEPIEQ